MRTRTTQNQNLQKQHKHNQHSLHPFIYYWSRPLGSPETCRRLSIHCRHNRKHHHHNLQRTNHQRACCNQRPSVWAPVLQTWKDLQQAIQKDASSSTMTTTSSLSFSNFSSTGTQHLETLQVEGPIESWNVFVESEWWHLWISLMQKSCPKLERIILLFSSHDNEEEEEKDDNNDPGVCLMRGLFFGSSSPLILRNIEFLDEPSSSVRVMRHRLELLARYKKLAPLESITWNAGYGSSSSSFCLTDIWMTVLRGNEATLRKLKFEGDWKRFWFAGNDNKEDDDEKKWNVAAAHAATSEVQAFAAKKNNLLVLPLFLEQAGNLEVLDLQSEGGRAISALGLPVGPYLQLLMQLRRLRRWMRASHATQQRYSYYASMLTATSTTATTLQQQRVTPATTRTKGITTLSGHAASEQQQLLIREDLGSAALQVVEAWYRNTHRPAELDPNHPTTEKKSKTNKYSATSTVADPSRMTPSEAVAVATEPALVVQAIRPQQQQGRQQEAHPSPVIARIENHRVPSQPPTAAAAASRRRPHPAPQSATPRGRSLSALVAERQQQPQLDADMDPPDYYGNDENDYYDSIMRRNRQRQESSRIIVVARKGGGGR